MTEKFGYFDTEAKEYVVTRPDTPLPWMNYLGADSFYGICSNTGGGYAFYKDARMRRITRYRYNDSPMDNMGRYLYVKEGDVLWNPGWKPVRTKLDAYQCRHGLGYTQITGEKNGLELKQNFFIPPNQTCEIWQIKVANKSTVDKHFKVFSYIEFCFYEALNDMSNFQRTYNIGEVEVDGAVIYHKTEYRERRNHYVAFACSREISGYDTSREEFIGIHNGLHDPVVPLSGQSKNSMVLGWNPIGSHHLEFNLSPGEEETFSFVLAYVELPPDQKFEIKTSVNKAPALDLINQYTNEQQVEKAFNKTRDNWQRLLSNFQVDCPHRNINLMVNTWNQYQCMATFNFSRSASFFDTGIGRGMGFRDSNQDLLGFVHMIPEKARERILDLAATQMSDGSCYHQYQPLTKKGNEDVGSHFNDDHHWLLLAICSYLKETGDRSILDEKVGYADLPDSEHTLFHHIDTSINYTLENRGPHGLPLIGHADWNDCLNLNCFSTDPNESFQTAGDVEGSIAESVMIAGLFLYTLSELEELYQWLGDVERLKIVTGAYHDMLTVVETQAWDGEWYLRAFDAKGRAIGSKANKEGQMFIESQAWCLLGGAGKNNGRVEKVLKNLHERLYTPDGLVLHQPAFTEYHPELGEITSYPPGQKENAGVFCHNNTWVQLFLCTEGQGELALEYYDAICPSSKESEAERYKCEPYVYAQVVAGKDSAFPGEARNSWLTGTAAWSFVVASQGILGIQPGYEFLTVDPCVPGDWQQFSVTRKFRGATYDIEFINKNGVNKGVQSVEVDGRRLGDNKIPLLEEGRTAKIKVIMG